MDKILDESAALDHVLLTQDPEQYDKLAAALSSKLRKIPLEDLAATQDILTAISPASHTILYLYALLATIEASSANGRGVPRQLPPTVLPEAPLWPHIVQTLLDFDPIQVRYCGPQLTRLVDYVAWGAEQTSNYIPAIQLLHHVILRLDSTASTLTSTHRSFIRLCLLSQAYSEAIDILDRPIYHIPTTQVDPRTYKYLCSSSDPTWTYLTSATGLTHPVSSRTYLEYYLLGGMCYLAMRRYKDALFFLEVVITAPVLQNVASSIMVEAYKKWLLVGLLLRGAAPSIPKSASQSAMKHIRAAAKPYECVADAFKVGNAQKLRAEIEAGGNIWQEEGNYGLMVEVFEAFRKFSVLRLGRTYDALPISEVARRTSPDASNVDETRVYLETLIAGGDVKAAISDADGTKDQILRFQPAATTFKPETEYERHLAVQTRELKSLLGHIQDTEHRMEVSKEYIDYLKKLKKAKDEEKKNPVLGASTARTATAADDVDEDMMEEY
ncbi:hypothetical protein A1O1_03145 [Capronia coronata CBS 617.96]|uniref:COP9 signalosome complex subunit 3 N-terminal helical repeats domain-containing protein n=1 Tax=Capronia coronata CBS 617.96 TaxID=1182541 RepID=W9YQA8_9EURO|nr:uncharacterized protein A1O1_03145 [Capronia coronata CBS 617.96]EXJ94748.1 hypothetical protein A1O1_03145 [Capronia coronata CBS 617.96]